MDTSGVCDGCSRWIVEHCICSDDNNGQQPTKTSLRSLSPNGAQWTTFAFADAPAHTRKPKTRSRLQYRQDPPLHSACQVHLNNKQHRANVAAVRARARPAVPRCACGERRAAARQPRAAAASAPGAAAVVVGCNGLDAHVCLSLPVHFRPVSRAMCQVAYPSRRNEKQMKSGDKFRQMPLGSCASSENKQL